MRMKAVVMMSRTPHGVRGLKRSRGQQHPRVGQSHPSRGAWIETGWSAIASVTVACRTPHGVRGLKPLRLIALVLSEAGRTPHGVRGLKPIRTGIGNTGIASHPSRGAWIETVINEGYSVFLPRRTPHGVRGLKLDEPSRPPGSRQVAPLTGCVD